jgi:hypothetical protein
MKKHLFISTVFALFISLFSVNSFAITICFGAGNCYTAEGSCDGWCPDAPASPTCGSISYNPTSDHILVEERTASVVSGGKTTPIVSDKFALFATKIKTKYAKTNNSDKKIQEQILSEYQKFLKTDDRIVGKNRLDLIAKETGLKIVFAKK